MDLSTLGLSPTELGAINKQQIQRQQNVIDLLGKTMTHKVSSARQVSDAERSKTLNRLTETQIDQNQPTIINVGGKDYQTTKGNMSLAMKQISRSLLNQTRAERSEYDNEPMTININGDPFQIRRHEFKTFSEILANQEELGIKQKQETRDQVEADRLSEGIRELSTVKTPEDMTAETAAKTGELGTWMSQSGKGKSAADERNRQELRKNWVKLHKELNTKPEEFADPLAASRSANELAEELGETVASVVFPEGIVVPWGFDLPKNTIKRMDKLTNPQTGKLMTIRDVREQAKIDGMTLNDALQILYLHNFLKKDK